MITTTLAIVFLVSYTMFKQPAQAIEAIKLKKQGYVNTGKITGSGCQALVPECGYCRGVELDGYCYEKK